MEIWDSMRPDEDEACLLSCWPTASLPNLALRLVLSFFGRNTRIFSSLFLSKTDESKSSGFIITSSVHGSTLTIFCSPGQSDCSFVSVSLFPRGCVLNINRVDVIQTFAALLSPSVRQLRFSVLLIVLPPD